MDLSRKYSSVNWNQGKLSLSFTLQMYGKCWLKGRFGWQNYEFDYNLCTKGRMKLTKCLISLKISSKNLKYRGKKKKFQIIMDLTRKYSLHWSPRISWKIIVCKTNLELEAFGYLETFENYQERIYASTPRRPKGKRLNFQNSRQSRHGHPQNE